MKFLIDIITEKSLRQFLLSLAQAQKLIIFFRVNICTASGIESIDKDHIAMFPYCGSMSQKPSETQSRAINAEDSKLDYRWAVIVVRKNTEPKNPLIVHESLCSGSIITDRYDKTRIKFNTPTNVIFLIKWNSVPIKSTF